MTTTTLNIGAGVSRAMFKVTHNLDEFGMSIEKAFCHWRVNRRNLTADMFCRYIRQKDKSFICLPEEEAQRIAEWQRESFAGGEIRHT